MFKSKERFEHVDVLSACGDVSRILGHEFIRQSRTSISANHGELIGTLGVSISICFYDGIERDTVAIFTVLPPNPTYHPSHCRSSALLFYPLVSPSLHSPPLLPPASLSPSLVHTWLLLWGGPAAGNKGGTE